MLNIFNFRNTKYLEKVRKNQKPFFIGIIALFFAANLMIILNNQKSNRIGNDNVTNATIVQKSYVGVGRPSSRVYYFEVEFVPNGSNNVDKIRSEGFNANNSYGKEGENVLIRYNENNPTEVLPIGEGLSMWIVLLIINALFFALLMPLWLYANNNRFRNTVKRGNNL